LRNELLAMRRAGYLRPDPSERNVIQVHCDEAEAPTPNRLALPVITDLDLPGRLPEGNVVDVLVLEQEIGGGAPVSLPPTPVEAERQARAVYRMPKELVGPGPLFMLRVRGDSMVDAGVLEGDYVLVRAQPTAEDGDMVVALLEEDPPELTVKYLKSSGERVDQLLPARQGSSPIEGRRVAAIQGKVVAVIRPAS
jgi:repressor LexA